MQVIQINRRDKYGRFLKGVVPWNKEKHGYLSEKVRQRISAARKKYGLIGNQLEGLRRGWGWSKGLRGVLKPNRTSFKVGHKWPKDIEIKRLLKLKETVTLKPNLNMDEDLGYVVGLLLGDGFVCKHPRTYRACLEITDKTIALNFFNSLKFLGLNPFIQEIIPSNNVGKLKKYRVSAYSLIFGKWFKSLSSKKLKSIFDTERSIIGFLRGFYEAEGGIYVFKNGTPQIRIHNTNLQIIKLIQQLSLEIGIKFNRYGPYKNRPNLSKHPKPVYRLSAYSQTANDFLRIVGPNAKNLKRFV